MSSPKPVNFQSHFGLILSINPKYAIPNYDSTFNPILVWFYQDFVEKSTLLFVCFQSHFGLILSAFEKIKNKDKPNFQSHFGLILSSSSSRIVSTSTFTLSIPFWSDFIGIKPSPSDAEYFPFNPILVWFYRSGRRDYEVQANPHFQSHFGLILSLEQEVGISESALTFNPILVWFYLVKKHQWVVQSPVFQSHFGLILSVFSVDVKGKTYNVATFNPILVWFYHTPEFRNVHFIFGLSIPFWSDFILT